MRRHEWQFQFQAGKLAEAAAKKRIHHTQRFDFWTEAKAKVMAEVRETGIDVLESQAGTNYTSNKGYGPQVTVKTELQLKLTECYQKLQEHDGKIKEYDGWVQVLKGNPDNTLLLNADDYLYFFGV